MSRHQVRPPPLVYGTGIGGRGGSDAKLQSSPSQGAARSGNGNGTSEGDGGDGDGDGDGYEYAVEEGEDYEDEDGAGGGNNGMDMAAGAREDADFKPMRSHKDVFEGVGGTPQRAAAAAVGGSGGGAGIGASPGSSAAAAIMGRSFRRDVPAMQAADSKGSTEYEEDFEEYDGEGGGGAAGGWDHKEDGNPSPNTALGMGRSNRNLTGAEAAQEKLSDHTAGGGGGGGGGAPMTRRASSHKDWEGGGAGDKDEDRDEFSAQSLQHHNYGYHQQQYHQHNGHHSHYSSMGSTGMGVGSGANSTAMLDPFHETDGSLSSVSNQQYGGTLQGESSMWEPVWTQKRGMVAGGAGVGGGAGGGGMRDVSESVTMDVGTGLYEFRKNQGGGDSKELFDGEELDAGADMAPRNSELSEEDIGVRFLLLV
jgi:hypothetical protein